MPIYEYKAIDGTGKKLRGVIDAENPKLARTKLRSSGIFPLEVYAEKGEWTGIKGEERPLYSLFMRVSSRDLTLTTRQLATLISAGIPLVNSLDVLITQIKDRTLKRIISRVREEVTQGKSFSDALSIFPRTFSDLYVNMVRAGELSGSLPIVLSRLSDLLEGQLKLRNKIRTMLAYPAFMLFIGLGILSFIITYVIPVVTRLFMEAHQSLPLPTLILITVSEIFRKYGWIFFPAFIFLILSFKKAQRTIRGKDLIDRFKLKIPYFGHILNMLLVARFARGVGTLLQGGIPLTEALIAVKAMVSSSPISRAIDEAIDRIRGGEGLSNVLGRSRWFPPVVIQMIASGEKSGALEAMLIKAAEAHEEEVETSLSQITSLLEPILVLIIGAIVGFIVLAVLLPILQMSQLIH
jgi:general secretion pathway protein F